MQKLTCLSMQNYRSKSFGYVNLWVTCQQRVCERFSNCFLLLGTANDASGNMHYVTVTSQGLSNELDLLKSLAF